MYVKKAVEKRLAKVQREEDQIKAQIDHMTNVIKEEERLLAVVMKEKQELETFLSGDGNEGNMH